MNSLATSAMIPDDQSSQASSSDASEWQFLGGESEGEHVGTPPANTLKCDGTLSSVPSDNAITQFLSDAGRTEGEKQEKGKKKQQTKEESSQSDADWQLLQGEEESECDASSSCLLTGTNSECDEAVEDTRFEDPIDFDIDFDIDVDIDMDCDNSPGTPTTAAAVADTCSDAMIAKMLSEADWQYGPRERRAEANMRADDTDDDLQLAIALSLNSEITFGTQADDYHQQEEQVRGTAIDWTGTVAPSQRFTAYWVVDLAVNEFESGLHVDPWWKRTFVSADCNGACVHRRVVRGAEFMRDDGKLRVLYAILTSQLQAPQETGEWTEIWRLRNDQHQIIGPALRVRATVSEQLQDPREQSVQHLLTRRKMRQAGNCLDGEKEEYLVKVMYGGLADGNVSRIVESGTTYKYDWRLQNTGKTAWPAALALVKKDAEDLNVQPQFIFTDIQKKLINRPIAPNEVARLIVSDLIAPAMAGWHRERWKLSCAKTGVVLIGDLNLIIRVKEPPLRPHTSQDDLLRYHVYPAPSSSSSSVLYRRKTE